MKNISVFATKINKSSRHVLAAITESLKYFLGLEMHWNFELGNTHGFLNENFTKLKYTRLYFSFRFSYFQS